MQIKTEIIEKKAKQRKKEVFLDSPLGRLQEVDRKEVCLEKVGIKFGGRFRVKSR
jgi:hypothetical protein